MSRMSRCKDSDRVPRALPLTALIKVVMVFSVLLIFGLAHLHLQFSLNALASETNQLQSLQSTLQSEVRALRGKTQALKRPERLFEYAKLELGMVPYRETERDVLRIPRDVFTRYEVARATQAGNEGESQEFSRGAWLNELSERVGLLSQALASEMRLRK
jgi:hypothetical protein